MNKDFNNEIMSRFEGKTTSKFCICFMQTLVFYLLITVLFVYTFVTIVSSIPSASKPLYIPTKEIRILTDANFSANVYDSEDNSDHIQVIQFYNSWCGHCISFAPTFKSFASDVRQWSRLMSISVVDCAQDINTKLCRNMDIYVYPTIKFFWFSPKSHSKGEEMKSEERTVEGLRSSVIKWTVENWSKGVPRLWPDLMPMSALSKDQFIKSLPIEKGIPIIIVVESEQSLLGREIILDLSAYQNSVIVLRMLDSSEALLKEILLPQTLSHFNLPFLLTINNSDYKFKFLSMPVYEKKKLREMFVKLIKSQFISEEQILRSEEQFADKPTKKLIVNNNENTGSDEHIYMSDLNNALRYSLFQEIALKKRLNTTQINALKNYLTILELHFPFQTQKMLTFVKYLNEWLAKRNPKTDVDMEDMITTMKIYEEYYHFPDMKPWKACAGSDGKYRGYPCSLWTLFHTLTVSEYKNVLKSSKWSTLHAVLYAMRDYIKYFFGCTYCAKHFQLMAKELEITLIYPNSSVLWLWKAHNKANLRLKGDASEDPKFPKGLYPKSTQCSDCYKSDTEFDDQKAFDYLLSHYSSDNIIKDETEFIKDLNNEKPQKVILNKNGLPSDKSMETTIRNKWNYSLLNGMDYSLILFLYFSSAAIILSLCLYLKIKVRKRGQKYNSLKSFSYA